MYTVMSKDKVLHLLVIMAAGIINYKVGAKCIRLEGLNKLYATPEEEFLLTTRASCFLHCILSEENVLNVS